MDFIVDSSLTFILREINRNIVVSRTHQEFEFEELLKDLTAIERMIVAKHFCKLPWNLGSLQVLSVLQDHRIITAPEFVLSQNDENKLQLVFNDFFEDKFELMTRVLHSAYHDTSHAIRLSTLVDDNLSALYSDLVINSELNHLDYLITAKQLLSPDLFLKLTQRHLSILLALHKSKVNEAFLNFSSWINEGVDDIKCIADLFDKLICFNAEEALSYLFQLSTNKNFCGWKFYLILLQTIASKCEPPTPTFIKRYLQSRLRQLAALPPAKDAMQHLLLSARAATATTLDIDENVNAYADWYKLNIGEMKFVLKTEEFQNVVEQLQQCIDYEMEMDYLEIHASISISPPVLCGKLVQAYKSKCKSRLAQLKLSAKAGEAPPSAQDAEKSIVIEDSD